MRSIVIEMITDPTQGNFEKLKPVNFQDLAWKKIKPQMLISNIDYYS